MKTVFDTIKDRLPITEVLSTYVTLIPSGTQFKAKCPFHNERSASFSVSPDRGLYYCFGCGAKGDIFTFVEQFEGVDKKGALKILAERAGVELSKFQTNKESNDPLYEILERTTTNYQLELKRNKEVLEYLHKRGIGESMIDTFRIGYVPDEWRFIANTLTTAQDCAIGERAGLIKKTEKGYYDRFRKRIMFPLNDSSGRVVGFSGRLFPDDENSVENKSPKYLNSPETEIFQKSRILFGFDKAKSAIRNHHFAILVEGQIDVVLAHQAGFRNTVATSGTAVSEASASDPSANLAVLARLTPNVFLAFDGDAAGQKALDHAAIVSLSLSMNPKVVPLPDTKDPADYILENGADAWKELLKESKHFILHQLKYVNRSDISAHLLVTKLKERVFPFLVRIKSPIEQSVYFESIAKELSLSKEDIISEFNLFKNKEEVVVMPIKNSTETAPTIEERFLGIAKRFPSDKNKTQHEEILKLAFEEHKFILPEIKDEGQLLAQVERDYGSLSPEDRDSLSGELAHKIEESFFAKLRLFYSRELENAEREKDDKKIEALLLKLQTLNQRRHGG